MRADTHPVRATSAGFRGARRGSRRRMRLPTALMREHEGVGSSVRRQPSRRSSSPTGLRCRIPPPT
jgi:hypothetical protein